MRGVFYLFTTINECTSFLFQLKASTHKKEPLFTIRKILSYLGNPQEKVSFVHIAGSNGKGSTLNALKEMLMGADYRVGAFISPHLERVNERITISNIEISDEQFIGYTNQLVDIIEQHCDGEYPSFFEMLTIIALLHFANEKVDIALMETGIGGRLDSTNVITPLVSIITTISLEHTEILGDTYAKVAFEKAGIIKEKAPIVTAVQNEEALTVIRDVVKKQHAPLFTVGKEIQIFNIQCNEFGQQFDYQLADQNLQHIQLTMLGSHQVLNASLAITTALILWNNGYERLTESVIKEALVRAKWAGRFEKMGDQIILDGAHNSEGTAALINTLNQYYPHKKYKFIYAAMSDKDHGKSIELMDTVAHTMSFTQLEMPRAAKATTLAAQSSHHHVTSDDQWQRLVQKEIDSLTEDELLIITGSLYFIAEARHYIKQQEGISYDTKVRSL